MGRFEWLKSVWAIVGAMALGTIVGLYAPTWAEPLSKIGSLYISFLIMCVPPIMLTAVIAFMMVPAPSPCWPSAC